MRTTSEGSGRSAMETTLVRAGYALAGALAAAVASWALTFVPWPTGAALASYVAASVAMAATLMLWASFKPSRGSAGSAVLEALLVLAVVVVVQMAGDMLRSGSQLGLVEQFFGYALSLLIAGLGVVLPASWMLGSNARWARRSLRWVAGELVFAVFIAVLSASGVFSSWYPGVPLGTLALSGALGVLNVAAVLAAAASIQRLLYEAVCRARGPGRPEPPSRRCEDVGQEPQSRLTFRHAGDIPFAMNARKELRAVCVVVLVASVVASVLSLAFFFACRHYAIEQGLELRNVVYSVPSACC